MRHWLLCVAIFVAGCGSNDSAKFSSETEELAYLKEVASPSPEQWKRRNELQAKADKVVQEERRKAQEFNDAQRAKEAAEKRLAEERKNEILRGDLISEAEIHEGGKRYASAVESYKKLLTQHADTEEAKKAAAKIKLLEPLAAAELRQQKIDELISIAKKCEQERSWSTAITAYSELVRDYPTSPEAKSAADRIIQLKAKNTPPMDAPSMPADEKAWMGGKSIDTKYRPATGDLAVVGIGDVGKESLPSRKDVPAAINADTYKLYVAKNDSDDLIDGLYRDNKIVRLPFGTEIKVGNRLRFMDSPLDGIRVEVRSGPQKGSSFVVPYCCVVRLK